MEQAQRYEEQGNRTSPIMVDRTVSHHLRGASRRANGVIELTFS